MHEEVCSRFYGGQSAAIQHTSAMRGKTYQCNALAGGAVQYSGKRLIKRKTVDSRSVYAWL